ncbi:MAG TPA: hypothetical protein VMU62_09580, partial [Acidobacteriaceae bacterium]|nr:hypothetical protein [Acidobacteriaceae bacterium]
MLVQLQPEEIQKSQQAIALFGQSFEQLAAILSSFTQPAYRTRQLWQALYEQRVKHLDQIAPFPLQLRQQLTAAGYTVGLPEIAQVFTSTDGT